MPIPTSDGELLFTDSDLTAWLGRTVTPERALVGEQVVWGWLMPILGTDVRPDPTPEDLFSWALELGAIAHENPAGLSERDLGPYREKFSAERRKEILDEVRGSSLAVGATPLRPRGSFPAASTYPDPVC